MKYSEAQRVVATRGWLTRTPPDFREAVLANCTLHRFAAGSTIFTELDEAAGVWGLARGVVGIESSGEQSDPRFVSFAGEGFWLGAQTLILGTRRQVGLVAIQPCVLLHLSPTGFQAIVDTVPEAWRWLAVMAISQIELALGTLEDLRMREPERRCAAMLLRLAGCRGPFAVAEPADVLVTQEQLSELINLSRTALGSVLRNFESLGLISRGYGKVVIDRQRLEQRLKSPAPARS